MKILMLTWEYPPRSIGGLSTHVYYLTQELIKLGHEIHLITCGDEGEKMEESRGLFIYRVVPYDIEKEDFSKWIMHLNFAMIEEGVRIINTYKDFNIIHGHDWLIAYAGKALKNIFNIPIITTIHSTEHGRNSGIFSELQKYIASVENFIIRESSKIIVCSNYMKQEVCEVLGADTDKINIIPNGVDLINSISNTNRELLKRNYAEYNEKIIFYIGRHVFEKGVHILIDAMSEIVDEYSSVKLIIAGTGPMTEELKLRVRELMLDDKICFVGHLNEEEKNNIYSISDTAVFPSLYEPFGIVALEAMAAGCPVVASDTGGFSEMFVHRVNGMKAQKGSAKSLAENILELLKNEALSESIKSNGKEFVARGFSWSTIAEKTSELYKSI